jgi:hypothetical protein
MREMIIPFTSSVRSADGVQFQICIIGHERADGIWEGVLEFRAGETRRVTGVETTQPNATSLELWAADLTPLYYADALRRARKPGKRRRSAAREGQRAI